MEKLLIVRSGMGQVSVRLTSVLLGAPCQGSLLTLPLVFLPVGLQRRHVEPSGVGQGATCLSKDEPGSLPVTPDDAAQDGFNMHQICPCRWMRTVSETSYTKTSLCTVPMKISQHDVLTAGLQDHCRLGRDSVCSAAYQRFG